TRILGVAMTVYRVFVAAIILWLAPLWLMGQTWDGGGANDNLTTAANWTPNVAPLNNGTADLLFTGPVRVTPKVNVNYDVHNVTFAGFDAYSLGQLNNSTLTVRGGV